MSRYPHLLRWLAWAALLDWLVTRSLTRAAIFMPKSPAVIMAYQGISFIGQLASTLTVLLVMAALGWMAWQEVRRREARMVGVALCTLLAISLWALFQPAVGWLAVAFQLLLIFCLGTLVWRAWAAVQAVEIKIVVTLVALTLLASRLFQLLPALYEALSLAGPPPLTGALFNAGELLVLLSIAALWWAFGGGASWKVWLAGALLMAPYLIGRLLNPSMTGILAIWSTGLTLYLPWPAYAGALWLACVTVIACLRRDNPAGWAIIFLAAGGYAGQLSYQVFLGLAALWLLVGEGSLVLEYPNHEARVKSLGLPLTEKLQS